MFIHIGGDTMVRLKDIIGIFDIQADLSQKQTGETALRRQSGQTIANYPTDIKSYVLTDKQVYYSPVSSATLKKRASRTDLHGDEIE